VVCHRHDGTQGLTPVPPRRWAPRWYFSSLVKLTSRRLLAGALGESAGVMLYVSFIDIFQKTMGYFDEAGNTPQVAFAYTTCCFFGGACRLFDGMCRCMSLVVCSESLYTSLTIRNLLLRLWIILFIGLQAVIKGEKRL
jgi:hypothetical protein